MCEPWKSEPWETWRQAFPLPPPPQKKIGLGTNNKRRLAILAPNMEAFRKITCLLGYLGVACDALRKEQLTLPPPKKKTPGAAARHRGAPPFSTRAQMASPTHPRPRQKVRHEARLPAIWGFGEEIYAATRAGTLELSACEFLLHGHLQWSLERVNLEHVRVRNWIRWMGGGYIKACSILRRMAGLTGDLPRGSTARFQRGFDR